MEFEKHFKILINATSPEQIFGNTVKTKEEIHTLYSRIAVIIHPDKWAFDPANSGKATEAFKLLGSFKLKAEERLKNGKYGKVDEVDDVVITTKKGKYTLNKIIADGDLSQVFLASTDDKKQVVVKIVKNSANNDLIAAEKETVEFLYTNSSTKDIPVMRHIVPNYVDVFDIKSATSNKGIIYPYIENINTVEDVITAYPNGIDVRDAAWMINRLLGALMVPHQAGIVHGAIVPNNFLLDFKTHNGVLVGWGFSVKSDNKLKAISTKYKNYYPKEVFDKLSVNGGLDVYMAAKIFLKLVGGNIETNQFPSSVPIKISSLFKACFLGPKYRTMDPYELHKDFSEELKNIYGSRKFREFKLNK